MRKLNQQQQRRIETLAKLPDDQIDTSDVPVFSFTGNAVRGRFYRPVKKPVSIRLDADVLDWLKQSGPGYQSRINEILRREMARLSPPGGGRGRKAG